MLLFKKIPGTEDQYQQISDTSATYGIGNLELSGVSRPVFMVRGEYYMLEAADVEKILPFLMEARKIDLECAGSA